jgi:hypothetical protein
MTPKTLSLTRFRELSAAYGANLDRWPASERVQARALVEASADARALLVREQELDTALREVASEPMPGNLAARLAHLPRERTTPRTLRFPRGVLWGPALGWAAAAAVGLWLGTQSAPDAATAVNDDSVEQVEQAGMLREDEILAVARGTIDAIEELP